MTIPCAGALVHGVAAGCPLTSEIRLQPRAACSNVTQGVTRASAAAATSAVSRPLRSSSVRALRTLSITPASKDRSYIRTLQPHNASSAAILDPAEHHTGARRRVSRTHHGGGKRPRQPRARRRFHSLPACAHQYTERDGRQTNAHREHRRQSPRSSRRTGRAAAGRHLARAPARGPVPRGRAGRQQARQGCPPFPARCR